MIIDAHVHMGNMFNFHMTPDMVLESADRYGIDYMLVSNVESSEVDHDQNPLPEDMVVTQMDSAKRIVRFAKDNPKCVGAFIWGKPLTEGVTRELKDFIDENREYIYGIKIHPYHSKLKFDDPRVEEYIRLAKEFELPVMTHTAVDICSDPGCVYNMAKKYPDTDFVMAHMELGTDNRVCIAMIKELPNLYGDTAWVTPENAIYAMKECGIDKIMFGSDNPIDGVDTYAHKDFYKIYLGEFKNMVSKEMYDAIMCENARRIYKLKV